MAKAEAGGALGVGTERYAAGPPAGALPEGAALRPVRVHYARWLSARMSIGIQVACKLAADHTQCLVWGCLICSSAVCHSWVAMLLHLESALAGCR